MTKTAIIARLPRCDFCRTITLARYDFKTTDGRWANGCEAHYRIHRAYRELGTGKGQRLVLAS